ncbi:conjugal transfer protein [Kribbella sp. NPDC059898]|uniref:conjugal transfer protein n=1 Tax=Kribbella sp. NPDC059898 TaxID=3346995 RepID=UPI0036591C23
MKLTGRPRKQDQPVLPSAGPLDDEHIQDIQAGEDGPDAAEPSGIWQKLRRKKDAAEESGELDTVVFAGQRMTTKLAHIGLAATVLCGPVGLFVAAAAATRPVKVRAAAKSDILTAQDAARVGQFAQRVVRSWLGATRAKPGDLGALFDNSSLQLPDKPTRVDTATTADVTPTSVNGIFKVTVAATVEGTPRYYAVPVQVSDRDGSLIALALPAPAAAPSIERAADDPYRSTFTPSGATSTAVLAFLRALLTGQGDVTRYISPGAPIEEIVPAPYARVDLSTVAGLADEVPPADGKQASVLATVVGTDAAKRSITTQYALTLKARGGRWEVTAIDLAPAIRRPRTTGQNMPSTPKVPAGPTASTNPTTPTTTR